MKYNITGHSNLKKDSYSKTITNENSELFNQYNIERQRRLTQQKLEDDINIMRQDINEIKNILSKLIENR